MVRVFDFVISLICLIVLSPVVLLLISIGFIDSRSPLFIQERVGRERKPFKLIKLRTMPVGTVSAASHLVGNSSVTKYGAFLRKTKLDELPQLWNVLVGDMSLVGPRPCLFNQQELVSARERLGVLEARPGITGLAQINGIDMSTPKLLSEIDAQMLADFTLRTYFKILFFTATGRGCGDAAG